MLRRSTLALAVAVVATAAAPALEIVGYTSAKNDRFSSGYPSAPVPNTSGSYLGLGYDLSGAGWSDGNARKALTMITPYNFIACVHDPFLVNEQVRFRGNDGVVHLYTVAGVQQVTTGAGNPTDLIVGKLTAAIPAGDQVRNYALATGLVVGSTVIGYGSNTGSPYTSSPHLGVDTIDQAATPATYAVNSNVYNGNVTTLGYINLYGSTTPNEFHVIGGDSGSPQFAATGGAGGVALAGITLANENPGTTPQLSFAGQPGLYATQINTAITALGNPNGYTVAVAPVPEPGTLLLAGGAAAALVARFRRRRAA